MPGTLFVVATPIGNLEDITARALRVLREVALIAAEDTRRTGTSAGALRHRHADHEPSRAQRSGEDRRRSSRGCSAARTSRSCPTPARRRSRIPGGHLIRQAIDAGVRVEPIPGPSAVAGRAGGVRASDRHLLVSWAFHQLGRKTENCGSSRLEAAGRHRRLLRGAPSNPRDARPACSKQLAIARSSVGRELTKAHEELVRGPISSVLSRLDGRPRRVHSGRIDIGQTTDNRPADAARRRPIWPLNLV